jgi:hypothetical protein
MKKTKSNWKKEAIKDNRYGLARLNLKAMTKTLSRMESLELAVRNLLSYELEESHEDHENLKEAIQSIKDHFRMNAAPIFSDIVGRHDEDLE